MYVSLAFLKRNPNLTQQEFMDYWINVHAPMCRRILEPFGCRRYAATFPVASSAQATEGLGLDAVVQLAFDTKEQMEEALASPDFGVEERRKSSAYAFDLTAMRDMVGREHDALV